MSDVHTVRNYNVQICINIALLRLWGWSLAIGEMIKKQYSGRGGTSIDY